MSKPLLIFILFLTVTLGIRLFTFYSTKPIYKDGEYVSFVSRVLSDPKVYGSYQSFSLQMQTGDTVFVKIPGYPEYYYGDKISVSGNLKIKLLNNKTEILTLDFPKISLVKSNSTGFLAVVNFIRQKMINVFEQSLPKNSSGLLLGIVFGIKGEMSKDFLQNLKISGVMHVVAASGMNVTMVGGFLLAVFSLIFKRQLAIVFSISGILFYAFLAGFEASILRASIMGIIAFSALILGKQQYSFYALLLTGFIMLILQPKFLFDIGFQLSFASTLGILYIPLLFKRWKNVFSGDLLTTISAQAATLPILLANFGTYSLWSVLVNALVLWTIPVLMILGGMAAIVAFIFAPMAQIILYLCLPFLLYFEKIISIFVNLEVNIVILNFPWQFSVAYYLFLASILAFALKRNNE